MERMKELYDLEAAVVLSHADSSVAGPASSPAPPALALQQGGMEARPAQQQAGCVRCEPSRQQPHFLVSSPSAFEPVSLAVFLGITVSLTFLWGFPCGSAGKECTCKAGDLGSIPGLGRPPGEGDSYPLQYSGLEKSMDCIVHGVAETRTQLSDFHFLRGLLSAKHS